MRENWIYLLQYEIVFRYFILCFILMGVMLLVAHLVAPANLTVEKVSAYECGFEPFMSTRFRFDVDFVIIAILFLVFDLELVFLLPWVSYLCEVGFLGFTSAFAFVYLLMFGFLLEWWRGILVW